MIGKILELLSHDEWIGHSHIIDVAKGKYKIPKTIKEKREQVKREKVWQTELKK